MGSASRSPATAHTPATPAGDRCCWQVQQLRPPASTLCVLLRNLEAQVRPCNCSRAVRFPEWSWDLPGLLSLRRVQTCCFCLQISGTCWRRMLTSSSSPEQPFSLLSSWSFLLQTQRCNRSTWKLLWPTGHLLGTAQTREIQDTMGLQQSRPLRDLQLYAARDLQSSCPSLQFTALRHLKTVPAHCL